MLVYSLNKFLAIKEGWKNVVKQRANKEDLRRQKICAGCEYAVNGKFITEIGDKLKEVDGLICSDCGGCPLISKIRQNKIICEKWKK